MVLCVSLVLIAVAGTEIVCFRSLSKRHLDVCPICFEKHLVSQCIQREDIMTVIVVTVKVGSAKSPPEFFTETQYMGEALRTDWDRGSASLLPQSVLSHSFIVLLSLQ